MKLFSNDPRFIEIDSLNRMLVVLKNPQLHENVIEDELLQDNILRNTVIANIEERLQEIIDEDSPFYNFINGME